MLPHPPAVTPPPAAAQCALVVGALWLVGDQGVRKRILKLLHQKGRTLASLRSVLLELRSNIGDEGELVGGSWMRCVVWMCSVLCLRSGPTWGWGRAVLSLLHCWLAFLWCTMVGQLALLRSMLLEPWDTHVGCRQAPWLPGCLTRRRAASPIGRLAS